MIRATVIASLFFGALAQDEMAPPEGFGTCRCLGKNNLGLTKSDCTYEWQDADGKCVHTLPNKTAFKYYPGSYGETCQKHREPGAAECFNITADPPAEKTLSDQETWCNDPWCYVDPCACDVKATKSSYFPTDPQLTYSYATCGSRNNFLAESELADTSTSVGDAVCKQDGKTSGGGSAAGSGGSNATSGGSGGSAATTTAAPGDTSDAKCLSVGLGMVLAGVALA